MIFFYFLNQLKTLCENKGVLDALDIVGCNLSTGEQMSQDKFVTVEIML